MYKLQKDKDMEKKIYFLYIFYFYKYYIITI